MKYKKFCLVLGGGGTKGAYEIGVWKALRESGIEIEAVIGTSIGALNALMIAQDDYERAEEIWNGLTMDQVLVLPPGFNPAVPSLTGATATFSLLGQLLMEKGELDNSPLQALIESLIDFEKLFRHKMDLGLVTFNLTKMRGEEFFLKDIAPEQLPDYIRASAAFPGFKKNKIGRQSFVDGGIFDNVPYRTARRRGYRHIIVVDVSGIGYNRPINTEGTETIFIKNSIEMGHVLDFRPDFIQDFKTLGYLDTLRVLGRCDGVWYFIKKERGIWRKWNAILEREDYFATIRGILPAALRDLPPLEAVKRILPKEHSLNLNPSQVLLESAALALKIPRLNLYTPKELLERVVLEYNSLMHRVRTMDLAPYKHLIGGIKEELREPKLLRMIKEETPLEIDLMLTRLEVQIRHPKLIGLLNTAFPYLLPAKIFFFLYVFYRRNIDKIPFLPRKSLALLPLKPYIKADSARDDQK